MRVRGVPAVVTGASRGIGEAIAVTLAARGCRVALIARERGALAEVAAKCRAAGGEAHGFVADVVDHAALARAVDAAAEWGGGLRVAVLNAGVGVHRSAVDCEAAAQLTCQVNFLGAVATASAAIPHLLAGRDSALVAVASLSALIPYRGGAAYAASKAALIAYLRCLRLELAGSGVRVGWVCPGPVRTAMIVDGVPHDKLPRLARALVPVLAPERVAQAVVALAEGRGGERVLPARAALFAGFARLAPRLAERVELLTGAGEA
jgi:3-oxoacyl-[acyl-carrier protein] reductase